jgi:tRNA uridine 5-carbamoylmethylation protein Kti12
VPLVTINGLPCSGKTTFANFLLEYLKSNDFKEEILLVNEGIHLSMIILKRNLQKKVLLFYGFIYS